MFCNKYTILIYQNEKKIDNIIKKHKKVKYKHITKTYIYIKKNIKIYLKMTDHQIERLENLLENLSEIQKNFETVLNITL